MSAEKVQKSSVKKVYVYTTPGCAFCYTLKEFLKDHKIDFEEIDVMSDEEKRDEMIKKSDQMSVPVIEIDGEIIVGFDKKKMVKLLGIKE